MNSFLNRKFRDLFAALPKHVQRQARQSYRLFLQDPAHPGLHFKQVNTDPPLYSARVGIGYRVIGTRDRETIIWIWIGSHAGYDQYLASLKGDDVAIRADRDRSETLSHEPSHP